MRVLIADEMRQLDAHMIIKNTIPSLLLMENAAYGVFEVCREIAKPDAGIIHVFCGVGNNGGDGFAAARILIANGYSIQLYLIGSPERLKGDALINAEYFIRSNRITSINSETFSYSFGVHDIIIDAIFGIGLSRDIEGVYKSAISAINCASCPIIAVDIPSGLNADTGAVKGIAVKATYTIAFQYPKPAHFLQPGKSHCGIFKLQKIGIDNGFVFKTDIQVVSRAFSPLYLPKREPHSHKGTYGTLGLIVASDDMYGAGWMCAKAALKSGVGLLHLFVPQSRKDMFASSFPEAVLHTQDDFLNHDYQFSALAIGPGLSKSPTAVQLVNKALSDYSQLPKVLDADALNIIAENRALIDKLTEDNVLTPHPKEFSRLAGLSIESVLNDPILAAQTLAKSTSATVLLKLPTSVACSSSGAVRLIDVGTPGMARGGSGDVLSGIIGAFLAQSFSPLKAATIGSYIAGVAGEMAAQEKGEYSMSPLDTVDMIARAVAQNT